MNFPKVIMLAGLALVVAGCDSNSGAIARDATEPDTPTQSSTRSPLRCKLFATGHPGLYVEGTKGKSSAEEILHAYFDRPSDKSLRFEVYRESEDSVDYIAYNAAGKGVAELNAYNDGDGWFRGTVTECG